MPGTKVLAGEQCVNSSSFFAFLYVDALKQTYLILGMDVRASLVLCCAGIVVFLIYGGEKPMSSNGVGSSTPIPAGRRRIQVSSWLFRLLIAFIIGALIVLFFFTSNVVSR
jgi:hypothetical protein